jgi:hypothetical protein
MESQDKALAVVQQVTLAGLVAVLAVAVVGFFSVTQSAMGLVFLI